MDSSLSDDCFNGSKSYRERERGREEEGEEDGGGGAALLAQLPLL